MREITAKRERELGCERNDSRERERESWAVRGMTAGRERERELGCERNDSRENL